MIGRLLALALGIGCGTAGLLLDGPEGAALVGLGFLACLLIVTMEDE